MTTKSSVSVTRNIHGSVLIEIAEHKILTDLFFKDYWFARMHEKRGLEAVNLPRLSAIIGCHGVFDHWHPDSMASYRWKSETPVFCATEAMVSSAKRAGFSSVRMLDWGETVGVGSLIIEAVEAQYAMGLKVNNYILDVRGTRVFFGSETRDIEPILRYSAANKPVGLALLPIDGATVFGQRLVTLPHEAINAARILGAKFMIPIHYSLKSLPPILMTPASINDLKKAVAQAPDMNVVVLPTGERREFALPSI